MIPDWLSVLLLSALPVTELRASLPLAVLYYGLDPVLATALALIGNAIPLALIFILFTPFLSWAKEHSVTLHRLIETHLKKLERTHGKKYHRWGALFLCVFVAVPLPGSGVWTASLLAVLFGMRPRLAVPAILLGMAVAAGIVVWASLYAHSF